MSWGWVYAFCCWGLKSIKRSLSHHLTSPVLFRCVHAGCWWHRRRDLPHLYWDRLQTTQRCSKETDAARLRCCERLEEEPSGTRLNFTLTVFYSALLYSPLLYSILLYYNHTVLYWTLIVLYSIVLYCSLLYTTVFYCTLNLLYSPVTVCVPWF